MAGLVQVHFVRIHFPPAGSAIGGVVCWLVHWRLIKNMFVAKNDFVVTTPTGLQTSPESATSIVIGDSPRRVWCVEMHVRVGSFYMTMPNGPHRSPNSITAIIIGIGSS